MKIVCVEFIPSKFIELILTFNLYFLRQNNFKICIIQKSTGYRFVDIYFVFFPVSVHNIYVASLTLGTS